MYFDAAVVKVKKNVLLFRLALAVLWGIKDELMQLNHTQFPSLGIFVCKKVGNFKNEDHFHYVSFKSCILGGLSFFRNPTFFLIKIPREGN